MVFHNPDTATYIDAATSLANSGTFERNGRPEIVRTPGYPTLMIVGLLIGRVEVATILLQVILSCFTIYFVFRIALLLFSNVNAALLSAALYALEPMSILYSSLLLTETLFTALLIIFVYFLLSYLGSKSSSHIIGAALALSAAIYVRPVSYFLPIVVTIMLGAYGLFDKTTRTKVWLQALSFFLCCIAAVGAWQTRNYLATGYSGFSAIKENNLYFHYAAAALAQKEGIPFSTQVEWMARNFSQTHPQCLGTAGLHDPANNINSDIECLRYLRAEGTKMIWENPTSYVVAHARGTLTTLFGPGASELFRLFKYDGLQHFAARTVESQSLAAIPMKFVSGPPAIVWANLVLGGILLTLMGLALLGLFSNFSVNKFGITAMMIVALYFVVIAGNGYSRFRHPVMPLICILSGSGLWMILRRLKHASVFKIRPVC